LQREMPAPRRAAFAGSALSSPLLPIMKDRSGFNRTAP
jgi:hypothetical protein